MITWKAFQAAMLAKYGSINYQCYEAFHATQAWWCPAVEKAYQVKRCAHGGGWVDADEAGYNNAADWNRRIIYIPVPPARTNLADHNHVGAGLRWAERDKK